MQYLPTYSPLMLWARSNKILTFDLTVEEWKPLFRLKTEIPVSPSSYAVLLDGDQVLLRTNSEELACVYLLTAGTVERLPNLLQYRTFDGFICLPYTRRVYSFGGMRDEVEMNSVEMLVKTRTEWEEQPGMIHPRHSFNPCLHLDVIFLCGGNETGASERFDPVTRTYEPLKFVTSPGSSVTLSLGDSLLIYSSYRYQHWKDVLVTEHSHKLHSFVTSSPPLLVQDKVYLFNSFLMKAYEFTLEGEMRLLS